MCYESGVIYMIKKGLSVLLVVLLILSAFGYLYYDLNQTLLAVGDASGLMCESPMIDLASDERVPI